MIALQEERHSRGTDSSRHWEPKFPKAATRRLIVPPVDHIFENNLGHLVVVLTPATETKIHRNKEARFAKDSLSQIFIFRNAVRHRHAEPSQHDGNKSSVDISSRQPKNGVLTLQY